jgi:hypothetical protein
MKISAFLSGFSFWATAHYNVLKILESRTELNCRFSEDDRNWISRQEMIFEYPPSKSHFKLDMSIQIQFLIGLNQNYWRNGVDSSIVLQLSTGCGESARLCRSNNNHMWNGRDLARWQWSCDCAFSFAGRGIQAPWAGYPANEHIIPEESKCCVLDHILDRRFRNESKDQMTAVSQTREAMMNSCLWVHQFLIHPSCASDINLGKCRFPMEGKMQQTGQIVQTLPPFVTFSTFLSRIGFRYCWCSISKCEYRS